jgi:hypothetical protein
MSFIKRFTRVFRRHKRDPRPISLECLMVPSHGLQLIQKISSELPAILYLACGCWRTRCTSLVTAEGLPSETRSDCEALDNSLRQLTGMGDRCGV